MITIVPRHLLPLLGLEALPDAMAVIGSIITQARGIRIRQINVQFGLANRALEVANSPHISIVCLNKGLNPLCHSDKGTLQGGDRRGVRSARYADSRRND